MLIALLIISINPPHTNFTNEKVGIQSVKWTGKSYIWDPEANIIFELWLSNSWFRTLSILYSQGIIIISTHMKILTGDFRIIVSVLRPGYWNKIETNQLT